MKQKLRHYFSIGKRNLFLLELNQLAQRERAAVRAISERRLGLNFAARD